MNYENTVLIRDLPPDVIMDSLLERYFDLLKKEDIGNTPKLTDLIDTVEKAITRRKEEIIYEQSKIN